LTLPDAIVKDLLAVGTFRLKEKPKNALGPEEFATGALPNEPRGSVRQFSITKN
jgi:hypothetical protein